MFGKQVAAYLGYIITETPVYITAEYKHTQCFYVYSSKNTRNFIKKIAFKPCFKIKAWHRTLFYIQSELPRVLNPQYANIKISLPKDVYLKRFTKYASKKKAQTANKKTKSVNSKTLGKQG